MTKAASLPCSCPAQVEKQSTKAYHLVNTVSAGRLSSLNPAAPGAGAGAGEAGGAGAPMGAVAVALEADSEAAKARRRNRGAQALQEHLRAMGLEDGGGSRGAAGGDGGGPGGGGREPGEGGHGGEGQGGIGGVAGAVVDELVTSIFGPADGGAGEERKGS